MTLMPIGEFARRSRLTPKALRIYDDLGLLRPVRTDPHNGYRWYAPEQLDRARLVLWLRHLGVPLARIRAITALPPAAAAVEVAGFWRQAEADHAARRDLAAALVTHLERGGTTMSTALRLHWAAHSDRGLVREEQQDAVHSAEGFLGVADGFGPRGGTGDTALDVLATATVAPGALVDALAAAAERAAAAVLEVAAGTDSGTTLTALAWTGPDLALVHIGDSRAYLLRDGELLQLTHDHTVTQRMVDDGALTEAEAATHPQRSILVRALPGRPPDVPDVHTQQARPGDRYLLCTDGLHVTVPVDAILAGLRDHPEPQVAVAALADLVRGAGAPDNVGLVVADVLAA